MFSSEFVLTFVIMQIERGASQRCCLLLLSQSLIPHFVVLLKM